MLPGIQVFGLLLIGSSVMATSAVAADLPADATRVAFTVARDDPAVGTYVSKPWGFNTSSYWIEGPKGLVLVDAQFLPSAAAEALHWAEKLTGKKATHAVVLHANPDKFNGTATLQARGIQVVTSRQVADLIPKVHELRSKWFAERYAPDYPKVEPKPDVFGAETMDVELAGLRLKLHVLGAGCSEAHVVAQWQGHLFVGDLISNGNHAWMEIGRLDEWLANLQYLRKLPEITHVHPGRGTTGGRDLILAQMVYLEAVRELVKAEKPKAGKPKAAGVERVIKKLVERYPGYDYEVFLELGLPAVWDRMASAGPVKVAGKAKK